MNPNTAPNELIAELDAGMLEELMQRARTAQCYWLCGEEPVHPAGLGKVGEKHG